MFAIGLGVLMILAGSVWVAQGLDLPFAPASFMSADPAWIAIGAAFAVAGIGVAGYGLRRRSAKRPDR